MGGTSAGFGNIPENLADTLDIGNVMNDEQAIVSQNGNVVFNPRYLNVDGYVLIGNNGDGVTGLTKCHFFMSPTLTNVGYGTSYVNKQAIDFNVMQGIGGFFSFRKEIIGVYSLVDYSTLNVGFVIVDNSADRLVSAEGGTAFCINSGGAIQTVYRAGIERALALGGNGLDIKTNDLPVANGYSVQKAGNGNENVIYPPDTPNGDYQHKLQTEDGILAHTSDTFANTTASPPTIAVDQNDYSPTGLKKNVWLRLNASANVNITGIDSTGFKDRDRITITNISSSNITLMSMSVASAIGNRILCSMNQILSANGESLFLMFDQTSNGWRIISIQN